MGLVALKCPGCGADIELDDSREFGFCNYCGTKVMQERLIIEHKGSISIDTSEEINNLYILARRAKSNNDFDNAQKYYEQLITKDPTSWEALFYSTYFQAINCEIDEIGVMANRITNYEKTIFSLVKENISDKKEQIEIIGEIVTGLIHLSSTLFNNYRDYHDNLAVDIKEENIKNYSTNCFSAINIVYKTGDAIIELYGKQFSSIVVPCWKFGVKQHNSLIISTEYVDTRENIIVDYIEKIKEFDPSYEPPYRKKKSGACYVATAVYGSYDCPQVWTLRRYRDNQLAKTPFGRAFIRAYYAISPTIVKCFGDTDWFKNMWRGKLDKMVSRLNKEGIENTPYKDIEW